MSQEKYIPCCPELNVAKWEWKIHEWNEKKFVHDKLSCFFHIPIWISKKIWWMWNKIEETGAWKWKDEDFLILFNDPSSFRSDMYMTVDKEVEWVDNVLFSWKFLSKTFQWPYSAMWKIMKEMEEYVEKEWYKAKKLYIHSAYCPKCAKHYWKLDHVVFAEI
jgi:hypothetical protein